VRSRRRRVPALDPARGVEPRRRPRRSPGARRMGRALLRAPVGVRGASPSGGALNVREATAADRPVLEELVASYLDEHWSRPYAPPPPGPYLDTGRIVVAEEEGEIVGLAKADERDGLGHVSLVYFKPEARGKGGGNDLLRELVTRFREQGFEHVSLNVELPN